ncbi:vWA domain-containing protein [Nitrincola alkalisediminis]|uniref:vWA domain-containing protein n=1 Tax=Nitrincola alkalisediminis TaxID=1366656 RepID=UPI0018761449|nr:VWA domain-containing protein [Nitrincola alkalisediminis]
MLIDFFETLRSKEIPATPRELLDLIRALQADLAFASMDDFYLLARTCLVKDEKLYDRFDLAFSQFFEGVEAADASLSSLVPDDWLQKTFERYLSDEDKAKLKGYESLDELMEAFKQRLDEQTERHAGGNKWIGTGGTSAFGHGGYHPDGIRVGGESRHRKAVKVWEKREFRNLDDRQMLADRNLQVALKRLRKFARTGAHEELDLDGTIRATAQKGYLDIQTVREKHNAVKVLLLLDIGGSMDDHIQRIEALFSACRNEFKHLEHFYFHNCVYESVWKDNTRRFDQRISTYDLIHKYGQDYKVILVGDASMSPYEIAAPGGSVEHFNEETGQVWLSRIIKQWPSLVWLNPVPDSAWMYTQSIQMIQQQIEGRMFPMTLEGLERAMKCLAK